MNARTARKSENLAERIYLQLKQDIFDFRLMPGDRFSENEVAERMGASRTPVREALFRLQRESYVDVLYRSGWQVKPFDFKYFEELYDVRTILECAAVRKLCEQQEQNTLDELVNLWCVDPADRLDHGPTVSGMDERFHEQLVEAAGNQEMARIHQDLTERLRIIRRLDFTKPPRVEATYEEHAAVLYAILHRRVEQAQMLLRAHIEESRNEVRKITVHMLHEANARSQLQAVDNNSVPRGDTTIAHDE
ncbi:GntR family transcriptional regulator [Alcanivorax sp. P2S70]|uniref:GntR family transcriptional regulator n=1 Tax=Alcanivorax sp. P2S70 TaxID=1397527 RepID=UPI0003B49ADF|nr:GntR family transcriptional regulator [Alcanivorax sp. P2S70]ERP92542.1 GntR family transcriptional regulator [Alcanivorax sp. P2S70]